MASDSRFSIYPKQKAPDGPFVWMIADSKYGPDSQPQLVMQTQSEAGLIALTLNKVLG